MNCTRRQERRLLRLRALPLVLFLLVPPGCGRKKSDDFAAVPRMDFHVNQQLLGPAVTDSVSGLVFRPPVFCLSADLAKIADLRRESRGQQRPDDPLAFEPVLIFGKPGSNLLCVVSRCLRPPRHGMDRAWARLCRDQARKLAAPAEVKEDLFRIGDNPVQQLVIPLPQIIQVRLICQGPGPAPVRVDYLIPRQEYQATMDGIESSIGSLTFVKP